MIHLAHRLAGSSDSMGLCGLAATLRELEARGLARDKAGYGPWERCWANNCSVPKTPSPRCWSPERQNPYDFYIFDLYDQPGLIAFQ